MASQGKNGKHSKRVGSTGKEFFNLQHNQLLINIHCIFSAHTLDWGHLFLEISTCAVLNLSAFQSYPLIILGPVRRIEVWIFAKSTPLLPLSLPACILRQENSVKSGCLPLQMKPFYLYGLLEVVHSQFCFCLFFVLYKLSE